VDSATEECGPDGGEGWVDGAVPGCFDVEEERGVGMEEEERGTGMEAHVEDVKEGARWKSYIRGGRGGRAGTGECVAGK
jgi:hypothetical protein